MIDLDATDDIAVQHQEGLAFLSQAEKVKITDQHSFELAAHFRAGIRAYIETLQARFKPQKQKASDFHKAIVAEEKALLSSPEAALKMVNEAMVTYERDKAREKMIAEARAAEEAKATGQMVPAQAVEVPKADGVGFVTRYRAEVTDIMLLAAEVVAGKMPSEVLISNLPMLNDMARAKKKAGPLCQGVMVVEDRGVRG